MHGVRVCEDLHLHMAAGCHVPLEIEPSVAERGAGLGGPLAECRSSAAGSVTSLTPATAAAGRLDEHRPAQLLGKRPGLGRLTDLAAGTTGRPASTACRRAASLSPTTASCSAVGPTEHDPGRSHASARRALSDRNP